MSLSGVLLLMIFKQMPILHSFATLTGWLAGWLRDFEGLDTNTAMFALCLYAQVIRNLCMYTRSS